MAQGECAIFVGGDPALFETCRRVFNAIAAATVHVGPVDAAAVTKRAANIER